VIQQAMVNGQAKRFYVFSRFRVDVTERLLYDAKGTVPLTPKAFDTLLVLVENAGRMLGKAELMEKIWPDSFVEENNLAQQIFALRKALGQEDGSQKYIETLPKRGYRFVADVRESFEAAETRSRAVASDDKTQADAGERRQAKSKLPLRDVVIIGRAIDFK
jgi:DNA-binding winged helix-turn-helix (wHTH) protein